MSALMFSVVSIHNTERERECVCVCVCVYTRLVITKGRLSSQSICLSVVVRANNISSSNLVSSIIILFQLSLILRLGRRNRGNK